MAIFFALAFVPKKKHILHKAELYKKQLAGHIQVQIAVSVFDPFVKHFFLDTFLIVMVLTCSPFWLFQLSFIKWLG